ncbi:hypothetical protein SeMB42_g00074 [Synchytrium endobioticum]|uniref:PAN2-PAN3 deadenylation complex subunit PAN3 n=1 Tax=Synchytrium endobioticum TaxID=286115 RepID=A0A507DVE5_9FUNG|nr:hypothetical protein SeLEV6574_g00192 [Synchytrium endobioticum]TPX54860.1 hypothetical protein SeMB42_g00074 [Synchytrium endobioticum]
MASKGRIPCRNIAIYGICKNEGKGCSFNHDAPPSAYASPFVSNPKLNESVKVVSNFAGASTSSIHPSMAPASTSAPGDNFNNLSSYNPYASSHVMVDPGQTPFPGTDPGAGGEGMTATDVSFGAQSGGHSGYDYYDPASFGTGQSSATGYPHHDMTQLGLGGGGAGATELSDNQQANLYYSTPQDAYYYDHHQVREPLQYHLYTTPLPHISNLHPHQKTIHSFFMSDRLREELQQRSEAVLQVADPARTDMSRLPPELHAYYSFIPLDDHQERSVKVFGYSTWVYRATSKVDGNPYVLRRIEGFRLLNESAMSAIDLWRRIRHANIVMVREAFTTRAFGDFSLVVVYDYHPLALTLASKYFSHNAFLPTSSVPEKTLWSYIVQVASALKTIHAAGLAARIIEPSKMLITGKNRIRLNCCGIFDLLTFDGGKNAVHFQQDDLFHFGQLIVACACGSLGSVHNLPKSLEHIGRHYSPDMKNVVAYLLSKPTMAKTIDDVVLMIGPRILHEINSAHHYNDMLESELGRELENGRLVRLMAKLNFINERPEFDLDPRWAETGDRYLLKLFRDYVFHQVDENGRPLADLGHVITCLNKLDVGIDEKVMLMSRDQQTILVVSYKELKQCLDGAISDLLKVK